ncbi:MAG: class I SAM-dependent methyltransferase [Thermoleophilia bacterium]
MGADGYREQSRERWERAAAGWAERQETIRAAGLPVSRRLVELVAPQPGQRILEVAAGLGDTGLMLAEAVRPGGTVIVTDGAPAMLDAARVAAHRAGADDVEIRQMEADWLDVDAASLDAIVSRFGYMLVVDPEAAFRDARRALRPGGRLAIAVGDAIEANPWIAVLQAALVDRGLAEHPTVGRPGMFGLASADLLRELLGAAGFFEITVEPVETAWQAPSLDAWWEHVRATSISLDDALDRLGDAGADELRAVVDRGYAGFVAPDGAVRLPARALVASAEA